MHISVYVPLWFWVQVCSWSCSLVARGLQAGRHFQDSKTQPAGLAPGSERWALKFLAFGGGEMKPDAPKFCFFLFFCPPPTPDQDPLVSGLGLSLFRSICTARASYSRQKLSAPFAFFVLLVPYYIQHGFLWGSQKFLLCTSGRHKILEKSLLTVRNGKPESRKTRACSVLFSVYIYIIQVHVYTHAYPHIFFNKSAR